MLDVEGFILVGGQSSRMGRDKSQLIIKGQTTSQLIADALAPVTNRVRLVGSHSASTLPNIPDFYDRWGPLGGIQAALQACRTDRCLIVACDLPFVTRDLFALLLDWMNDATTVADAIVPVQPDGTPQPLCAGYNCAPSLLAAEVAIAHGRHSPRSMLDQIIVRYLTSEAYGRLPNAEHFFVNLNHPEDYRLAQQIAATRQ